MHGGVGVVIIQGRPSPRTAVRGRARPRTAVRGLAKVPSLDCPLRAQRGRRMDSRALGLVNTGPVHANLPASRLVELALQRREGVLASNGALVAYTGKHTGRAARDKYVVRHPSSEKSVWFGPINQP